MVTNAAYPVLFFDGECNLCNGTVQFIIRHDKKKIFRFSPLQTAAGKKVLEQLRTQHTTEPDSVVLLLNGKYYVRSAAALHVLRLLGGAWQLLFGFMIVPRFIRDAVYDIISRNRYKWFGKRNECMVPTPALMDRFLME